MTLRWDEDCEMWTAWFGPVLMGSVERYDGHQWRARVTGSGTLTFRRLRDAQRWVEKRAEDAHAVA